MPSHEYSPPAAVLMFPISSPTSRATVIKRVRIAGTKTSLRTLCEESLPMPADSRQVPRKDKHNQRWLSWCWISAVSPARTANSGVHSGWVSWPSTHARTCRRYLPGCRLSLTNDGKVHHELFDSESIVRVLRHLGLPWERPPRVPPRAMQGELGFSGC